MQNTFSTTLFDILHEHILNIDDENNIFFGNEKKFVINLFYFIVCV